VTTGPEKEAEHHGARGVYTFFVSIAISRIFGETIAFGVYTKRHNQLAREG
jgi:hypothetical protein